MPKLCAADLIVAMSNPSAQLLHTPINMLSVVRRGSHTWGSAKTAIHEMGWVPHLSICCSLVQITS